jgi:tRNA nucleotidyltransferase (CCA-adding enzyme)
MVNNRESTNEIEVILTHEHTDFDALASMQAAALLFPQAIPVLPQQLNRNVSEFLALYKNQFRFVKANELPRVHVKRAILVDARSANWTRGMDKRTQFYIIDHHSVHVELPADAQVWTDEVGANTTMLTERLIREHIHLSPVQATLLTLGIHEDTGSLTYASTTARDARCLAWLLEPERGVNLSVVNHFLNHPLSDAQRALLEALIENSEFLDIVGHTIVIAQANAPGFTDEVSALAARLRDFHETDAIFLVIDLGDLIQVVARSSTDEIDVGEIMRGLGGGGHTRAAAAPIHGRDLTTAEIRNRLLKLVHETTRSATTVRDIMSTGRPKALPPGMTIAEAYELMQRWGHEGFPVVAPPLEAGKPERLLGVLTRREADRAMSHHLGDQPVSRFMRAGEVVAHPNDSIPMLRRTMIESNWGQIPVVNDKNEIIGIVTRTDLIKLWDDARRPERQPAAIARRLRQTLTPAQHHLLRLIGREVDRLNYTVYVVGGFVRDLLLDGKTERILSLDMDIVIEGDAIKFAEQMEAIYGGRVVRHKRFHTAKWLLNDPGYPVRKDLLFADMAEPLAEEDASLPTHLDFVTARTEFYTAPSVLPTVQSSSIKLDLHRRDFTINTLAVCLNPNRWGELLDTYGGLNDLEQGLVRVLHSLSFVDDPTRILRAVRYEQRFDFTIEPRTLELLVDALDLLEKVSPARVRHELERILQEEEPEKVLRRLDELGVLTHLHPDLHAGEWLAVQFARLRAAISVADADPALVAERIERLYFGLMTCGLSPQVVEEVVERFSLRGETRRLIESLGALEASLEALRNPDLRPSQVVRILDRSSPAARALLRLVLQGGDEGDSAALAALERYEEAWQYVQPALDGHDLQAMGIPRGPRYGEILSRLRAARLDGEIHSREEETAMVERMLAAE